MSIHDRYADPHEVERILNECRGENIAEARRKSNGALATFLRKHAEGAGFSDWTLANLDEIIERLEIIDHRERELATMCQENGHPPSHGDGVALYGMRTDLPEAERKLLRERRDADDHDQPRTIEQLDDYSTPVLSAADRMRGWLNAEERQRLAQAREDAGFEELEARRRT